MHCQLCTLLAGLALLLVDRFGKLSEVGVERSQESLDGEPLDATSASLDPRDVCGVHLEALGEFLLSDTGCVAQATKRTAKKAQLGVSGGLAHDCLGIPGQVAVSSVTQKIVGARAGRTAGRRGTESANSRRASQASSLTAWLPRQSSPPGASNHKEEPKMSTTTIPAEIMRVTRSAVLAELGDTAVEIEEASISYEREEHPETFAEPFERFDALRSLLDAIGWSNETPRPIDIDEYREPLAKALQERLVIDRYYVEDPSTKPAACEATEHDIAGIERFMAANDLRGDE